MHIFGNGPPKAGPIISIELNRTSAADTSYLKATAIFGIEYLTQLFHFPVYSLNFFDIS
jgi:hypothetical protein